MTDLRAAAQQLLGALDKSLYMNDYCGLEVSKHDQPDVTDAIEALRTALAEQAEPDSPERRCGGPGCDLKCCQPVQEPAAWRWGYRSVTTGEMDWRGYVEIAAHPNLRSPAIIMEPLYTAPPQRPAEPVQQALVEADRIMGHDDEATEWRERWAQLFGVAGSATSPWRESAAQGCSPGGTGMPATPPQRKPLAEWQINDLMADIDPEDRDSWSFRQGVYAAEKHHGVRP